MPWTTPNLALPYPDAGDPADVPADMGELADRIDDLAGAADGLATLDATGKVPASQLPGGGAVALDDLTDVTTAGVADDEVLTYDAATSTWQPAPGGGGAAVLDDLTDVDTSGAADAEVLTYNAASSTWLSAAPTGGGGGGVPADDTQVWMPLFDTDGSVVFDGTDSVIPTLIPIA